MGSQKLIRRLCTPLVRLNLYHASPLARTPTHPQIREISRVTLLRLPSESDQALILRQLEQMPMIDRERLVLSLRAGKIDTGPRTKGFSIMNQTEFRSYEDMHWYDFEHREHQAVKKELERMGADILTVYFEPSVAKSWDK